MTDSINNLENASGGLKKRLLFIVTQAELGGAQKFLSQLLNNLEPEKFECVIITGSEGNKEIKKILPRNVKYIISKHLQRNPNVFNDITSVFELKKIIKDFRPDTVFLNSSKAGFIGSLAARLLETKNYKLQTIYRIGGWAFNDPRPWWKNLVYRWLEKLSAPWKDYIIVNNKHDYNQAIKYGIKPRKEVVLIYNGIDPYKLEFLDKDEAKIRLYEKLPSDQKQANFLHEGLVIGTIANFYPTKGLGYLIEAMKILNYKLLASPKPCAAAEASDDTRPAERGQTTNGSTVLSSPSKDYKLLIIGDGPERENLQLQTIDYKRFDRPELTVEGLQTRVIFAGRIPDAYKYLKAFDIFVLPSVKEGFPWALLEAMSAKLPVIATAVGANPEIIEDKRNGLLVQPRDPQALADAIAKLVENEPLRHELGIQAHQTVLHKFDLRKMMERVETLL